MLQVFDITLPVYAETKEEAVMAQEALFEFISEYRKTGIAVTGKKITCAVKDFQNNIFLKAQISNYLTK